MEEIFAELVAEKPELAETIKAKEEKYSKEAVHHIVRVMMLQIIDTLWMEHLDSMEHLRSSVNLRAYGQRDPLVEYKKEGLRAFKSLEATLRGELVMFIENLDGFFAQQQAQAAAAQNFVPVIPNQGGTDASTTKEKIGRNDECPCGSGKKWKKCGELNTEEHQQLMAAK